MSDWVEHGTGVYVKRYDFLSQSIGAIDCGDGLVVVDTRSHPGHARELLADLAHLSSLPVGAVVNTHHHWDHAFGNAAFVPVPIWGHERCAARLRDEGALVRDRLGLDYPAEAEGFAEVEIVPPDRTFDGSADLECGSRRIGLHYLGLGHTDNDIVVEVDDGAAVFAGDLVEQAAPPFFGDGYPLEWPATVGRLLDLTRGAVVPGHGTVVDAAFVEGQAAELAEVARLAVERHAAGMPVGDAARAGGPYDPPTLTDAFRRAWEHLDRGDPVR